MSNQPTGDYRLLPWAYPPIAGGSDNSGGEVNQSYDFSRMRIDVLKTGNMPFLKYNGSTSTWNIHISFNIQNVDVVNDDAVSLIRLTTIPRNVTTVAGSNMPDPTNITAYVTDGTIEVTPEDFIEDPYTALWEGALNGNPGFTQINSQIPLSLLFDVVLDVLNESSQIIQTYTFEGVSY